LPTINYDLYNTRPYRYFYAISASSPQVDFYDQLVKVDTLLHTTKVWRQSNTYPGEPIFVPAPNSMTEDDGVILSVVLNPTTNGSFLVTLNATTFTEIARADTPHYAPFGFHGMYSL
jgi:beta,beta-carotene 9',10'-dioxygenase